MINDPIKALQCCSVDSKFAADEIQDIPHSELSPGVIMYRALKYGTNVPERWVRSRVLIWQEPIPLPPPPPLLPLSFALER